MGAEAAARPVLLVTGGSRGIGREICVRAGEAGWDVAFTYLRDKQAAFETVTAIEATGAQGAAFQADVAVQRDVRDVFAAAVDRLGKIDGLVNNAGIIGGLRSVAEADDALLLQVFRTNVFGTIYCTGEAARRMSTEAGGSGGVIVNISSAAARHGGLPKESHYAAAKGAVDSFTVAMAKELAPQGIRVNAVRPGIIATAIHEAHGGDEAVRRLGAGTPLGRAGTAHEVATTVIFLLGAAASYVHGALLDVAGGR